MDKKVISEANVEALYRGNNFLAASATSVYASLSRITKDGDILIESFGKIEDRHLFAAPPLPSLKTRSSLSSTKNLYQLSLDLAYEYENSSNLSDNGNSNTYKGYESDSSVMSRGTVAKKPRKRSPSMSGCSHNLAYRKIKVLKGREIEKVEEHSIHQDQLEVEDEQMNVCAAPVEIVAIEPTKQDSLPEVTQEPPPEITIQAEVQSNVEEKDSINTNTWLEKVKRARSMFSNSREDENGKSIVYQDVKSLLIEKIKCVVKSIDNKYLYTLLFLVGALAYLAYILFFDVSVTLNEEQKYLAKIRNCGLVMRFVYYVVRLFKGPIF